MSFRSGLDLSGAFLSVYDNEIATKTHLPACQHATDEAFNMVAAGSQFLPRLQLFTSASNLCKEGKFPVNNYGLVISKETIRDLGKQVNVIPVAWRPKALRIMDDGNIINEFDPKSPEFQKIVALSDVKDSGAMFGPEFLLYIPDLERFGSFYMASKSARQVAGDLKELMDQGKAATLDSKFIDGGKYKWQAPKIVPCSEPLDGPPEDQLLVESTKFNNPPKNEVETAETNSRAR